MMPRCGAQRALEPDGGRFGDSSAGPGPAAHLNPFAAFGCPARNASWSRREVTGEGVADGACCRPIERAVPVRRPCLIRTTPGLFRRQGKHSARGGADILRTAVATQETAQGGGPPRCSLATGNKNHARQPAGGGVIALLTCPPAKIGAERRRRAGRKLTLPRGGYPSSRPKLEITPWSKCSLACAWGLPRGAGCCSTRGP